MITGVSLVSLEVCCQMALVVFFVIFFFEQKTAYEMRISDLSSDVCSSDLALFEQFGAGDNVDWLGGIGRLEIVPPRARHNDFALRRARLRRLFGVILREGGGGRNACQEDRKSTRLNSSH